MTDLLSNEEIDTLLELFRAEGGGLDAQSEQILRFAATSKSAPPAERVDLLKPGRVPTRQRDAIERLFMTATRTISATVSDRLRLHATCECVAVERLRWSEWAARSRGPMAVFALDVAPFGVRGLATISAELLQGAVDRLLGGTGRVANAPSRFSAAELTVADGLVEPLLRCLSEALTALGEVQFSVSRRLGDVHLAHCVGEHDPVIAVRYEVAAEPLSGDVRLVLPFAEIARRLASVMEVAPAGSPAGAYRRQVLDSLREVKLAFQAVLGRSELALRELLELQVGDVVRLPTPVGEPVEGLIQGRPKLRGTLSPRQGRMVFRVVGSNEEERDGES